MLMELVMKQLNSSIDENLLYTDSVLIRRAKT